MKDDEFKPLDINDGTTDLPSEDAIGDEFTDDDFNNAPVELNDSSLESNTLYQERDLFASTLKNLINLLPGQYNKETPDTNYYKLLRSMAKELSESRIEIQQLKSDIGLSTVSQDRIYDNFGTLVKLSKTADWDSEKYKRLIQGVMQSLLKGPTKQSLIDGLNLFTDFKINVYELYKENDRAKVDPSIFKNINYQYSFVLEIEKPVEAFADQQALTRDANYIVNIIKPAHTISIIITTLVSEDSYRRSYRDRFNIDEIEASMPQEVKDLGGLPDYYNMDIVQTEAELNYKDNIYGYDFKSDNVFGVGSLIGGPDLIGPVYFLKDERNDWYFEEWLDELFPKSDIILPDIGVEYAENFNKVKEVKEYAVDGLIDVTSWSNKILAQQNDKDTINNFSHITDLGIDVTEIFHNIQNNDVINSYIELYKEESYILSIELEEYNEYGYQLTEIFNTPDELKQIFFDVNMFENYDNALDFNTDIKYEINDTVNIHSFVDIFTTSVELNPTENVNLTSKVLNTTTDVKYDLNDQYDKTKASDIVGHNVEVTDSFNTQLEITDVVTSDANNNYYESYVPKSDGISDIDFYAMQEVSSMVSIEEKPRFVFNQTPIGQARLMGIIRDQVTMVAG